MFIKVRKIIKKRSVPNIEKQGAINPLHFDSNRNDLVLSLTKESNANKKNECEKLIPINTVRDNESSGSIKKVLKDAIDNIIVMTMKVIE